MISNCEFNDIYGFSTLVDAERLLAFTHVDKETVQNIALSIETIGQRKLVTTCMTMFDNTELYIELKEEKAGKRKYVWVLKVDTGVTHTFSSIPFSLDT